MSANHIVKSYDDDLKYLTEQLILMGDMVLSQMDKAIQAMAHCDRELAVDVIEFDPKIDQLEYEIDTFAVRMIALRQPVARDLRAVVAALKISSHLERIADYASNISRRSLNIEKQLDDHFVDGLKRMVGLTQQMIRDVLHCYQKGDVEEAIKVWIRDKEVDNYYNSYFRELLTYMMEEPKKIGVCTELLFAAKNIERAGDHATNIAEMVHYLVNGTPFEDPIARKQGAIPIN